MADYIKREDALVAIKNLYPGIPFTKVARQRWNDNNRAYMQCERAVETIPAADVEEVRRGRWMTTEGFPHRVYCSCCYSTYVPNDNWQIWQDKFGDGGLPRDYCPNCGAKMDGGEDDA